MKSLCHPAPACAVLALAGVLAGCASVGAPVPPSLELPKPPADLRAVRKGSKVYLLWTIPTQTTDRHSVTRPGPTRVCRSLAAIMSECDTPVGNVPPAVGIAGEAASQAETGPNRKPQAEFTDTLPSDLQQQNPTRMATYAVEALNRDARSAGSSNQVQVSLVPTLAPPANFQAQVISDGVLLTWECEQFPTTSPNLHFTYRIYRRSLDTGADAKLADVDCSIPRYGDHTIEWQKSYQYRITVVSFVDLEPKIDPCPVRERTVGDTIERTIPTCLDVAIVEGDDSAPQTIFSKDIYPPGVPTGLQAVFSGPGQAPFVDLLWAPDTDADLAGYAVYRREEGTQPAKMNAGLVKTPAYRDQNVVPGKTYWYSVSAVDLRGNESVRSDEASEAVPQN
jgi:fibronectin type 3 domain-containing protein